MTIYRNFKQAVQLLMRLRRRRCLGIGARGMRSGRVRAARRVDDNVASRHAAILDNVLDRELVVASNSPMIVLSKAVSELVAEVNFPTTRGVPMVWRDPDHAVPGQDFAACSVHDGHEIEEAAPRGQELSLRLAALKA
jgi:hypothetical protein